MVKKMPRVVTILVFSWFKPAPPSRFIRGCLPPCELLQNQRKRDATQLQLFFFQYVFPVISTSHTYFITNFTFCHCARSLFVSLGALMAVKRPSQKSSLWNISPSVKRIVSHKKALVDYIVSTPIRTNFHFFPGPADHDDPSLSNDRKTFFFKFLTPGILPQT